jgi:deoxyinosine 3'endonuclease (endonuclease V)
MHPESFPQVVFVDGNGILHPERFGSACHIGVIGDLVTIGCGKNFLEVRGDGLFMGEVKREGKLKLLKAGDWMELIGKSSGLTYGAVRIV